MWFAPVVFQALDFVFVLRDLLLLGLSVWLAGSGWLVGSVTVRDGSRRTSG